MVYDGPQYNHESGDQGLCDDIPYTIAAIPATWRKTLVGHLTNNDRPGII